MTLRTAVVGAGIVSENNHLPSVRRNPRTELVAVADLDEESAREAAREYGGRPYGDAEEMLAEESLDWVHVATPVQSHHALAGAAIDEGVPVTVQKPATTDREELADLRERAEATGVPVSVVHNWLFYPVIRDLRRRIAAGKFGEVRGVEVTFTGEGRPDDTYRGEWVYDLPGGDLEEGMPHPLYLALGLGGVPESAADVDVQTRATRDYDGFDYDGTGLQWTTGDDVLCSVTYLSGSAPNNRVRVYGTDGSASVDVQTNTVDAHDADEGPFHFLNEQLSRSATTAENVARGVADTLAEYGRDRAEERLDRHSEASVDGHYYLLNEAAKAIERGEQPPVPLAHSAWVLELMTQVREDARA
ncbi:MULTISPECIES: Gfo/Idh/MocA family protein [Halorussus]|uniref:Gfo/Idh/MocA family protein n=1 Tax=Halorussus TaxID=1070314 RepID=UPI00209F7599|nr:Gfo/Idh/MocA family oxidoreductase [Halorussus vallis]USZ77306.1 Gfo/Idh/MocA family oxidoreductase [Halorussus vallis]